LRVGFGLGDSAVGDLEGEAQVFLEASAGVDGLRDDLAGGDGLTDGLGGGGEMVGPERGRDGIELTADDVGHLAVALEDEIQGVRLAGGMLHGHAGGGGLWRRGAAEAGEQEQQQELARVHDRSPGWRAGPAIEGMVEGVHRIPIATADVAGSGRRRGGDRCQGRRLGYIRH
jgi:hypothetical protein